MVIADRQTDRQTDRKTERERRAFDVASGDYDTVTDDSPPSE